MAPLPPNNTVCLWVKKSGVTGEHETMFRAPEGTTTAEIVAAAQDVCDAAKLFILAGDTFISARFRAAGGVLSFEVPWTPIVGTNATTYDKAMDPQFISFVGRDLEGRRTRILFQGAPWVDQDDYRILYSESAGIAGVIDALRDEEEVLCGISGNTVIWKSYANVGYNAYFQRQARKT